jgi:NitT/TauT family transport system ATP-binding protein
MSPPAGSERSDRAKLELRHVSLLYQLPNARSPLVALQDVSFEARQAEFLSVVGPSGCGKTSLLSIVDGLIPASGGTVLIDGRVVTKPGKDRAMVFQGAALLPWRTVLSNILFGLECQKVARLQAEARARELCALVRLNGFETAYPHQLSGGMQQRVNLARALAVDPEVLLMDEPFAALDAQTREHMQLELLQIWERTAKTVLFVTHQIEEAIYLSDRIVIMARQPGRVQEIVEVGIPRPRALSVKRSPEFIAYVDRIWSLIEQRIPGDETETP